MSRCHKPICRPIFIFEESKIILSSYKFDSLVEKGEGNGTHSSTLAWKIPWMEEPGGLQSMGLLVVGHD